MSPETRITISPGVYARAFGHELVLLDFSRGEYFGLDAVGAEIWRLAEAGETLGAITARIVQDFDVTHDVAFHDVVDLVTHMRDQGLITVRSSNDATAT
jgi:hypothetical protein